MAHTFSGPSRWLQVSGYRFLQSRIADALLGEARAGRGRAKSLGAGCLLTVVAVAGCALLASLRPQASMDGAPIVMGAESGALYVRVGDTVHPVLNLASARLAAGSDATPRRVREFDISGAKRGPLLGIPGAPRVLAAPLPADQSAWTVCDSGLPPTTTAVIVGPVQPGSATADAAPAVLVTADAGRTSYLLYDGRRAVVDLADAAVVRALHLDGRVPRPVSGTLLRAVPEAPPITAPRIPDAGAAAALPGFEVGTVIRVPRAGGDEYHVVLGAGVQRVGQVAADLLRFTAAHGGREIVSVAPDVLRSSPTVHVLAVSTFPDRPTSPDDGGAVLCATWVQSSRPQIALLTGVGLPLPADQVPVALAQADGGGPAVDAVYLPPGRAAYARATDARYLVTDTGVRYAIHDDDAERSLGLPPATPAPWPVLAALPQGPELSRQSALVTRDVVAAPP